MIDSSQPVTLKRHALINGNFYHPREYKPGELPLELLLPEYVTQSTPDIPTFSPFNGAFEQTTITIGTDTPTSEKAAFPTATVIVDGTTTANTTKIQINQATVEDISTLGLSLPIARKVAEERGKTPFTSLDDLKARVTLAKNQDWQTYSDRLLFDIPVTNG